MDSQAAEQSMAAVMKGPGGRAGPPEACQLLVGLVCGGEFLGGMP